MECNTTEFVIDAGSLYDHFKTIKDMQNKRGIRYRLQCRYARRGGHSLMRAAMSQLKLLARAYHHIPKLARTIADLAESEEIQSAHLA